MVVGTGCLRYGGGHPSRLLAEDIWRIPNVQGVFAWILSRTGGFHGQRDQNSPSLTKLCRCLQSGERGIGKKGKGQGDLQCQQLIFYLQVMTHVVDNDGDLGPNWLTKIGPDCVLRGGQDRGSPFLLACCLRFFKNDYGVDGSDLGRRSLRGLHSEVSLGREMFFLWGGDGSPLSRRGGAARRAGTTPTAAVRPEARTREATTLF